jgi:hypothetical protein
MLDSIPENSRNIQKHNIPSKIKEYDATNMCQQTGSTISTSVKQQLPVKKYGVFMKNCST